MYHKNFHHNFSLSYDDHKSRSKIKEKMDYLATLPKINCISCNFISNRILAVICAVLHLVFYVLCAVFIYYSESGENKKN